MTGGRERTLPEYRSLLSGAHFKTSRAIPVSDQIQIIEAFLFANWVREGGYDSQRAGVSGATVEVQIIEHFIIRGILVERKITFRVPTIHELSGKFRVRPLWKTNLILDAGKPLSMTSEVMDSNFPFLDTADTANDL